MTRMLEVSRAIAGIVALLMVLAMPVGAQVGKELIGPNMASETCSNCRI
jgi:hypothetical protein